MVFIITSQLLLIYWRSAAIIWLYSSTVSAQQTLSSPSTTGASVSTSNTTFSIPAPSKHRSHTAAIVGTITAGVIILLVIFLTYIWRNRRPSTMETNAWTGPDPYKPTSIFHRYHHRHQHLLPLTKPSKSKGKSALPTHSIQGLEEPSIPTVNQKYVQQFSQPMQSSSVIVEDNNKQLRQNFWGRRSSQTSQGSHSTIAITSHDRHSMSRQPGEKDRRSTTITIPNSQTRRSRSAALGKDETQAQQDIQGSSNISDSNANSDSDTTCVTVRPAQYTNETNGEGPSGTVGRSAGTVENDEGKETSRDKTIEEIDSRR